MRGCLGFLFYIFITIWIVFTFLVFSSVRSWAFNRDFYTDIINNDSLYEALRNEGLPQFLANIRVNGQPVLNPNSNAFPALVEATQAIIPQDFLQSATRTLVDGLFDFYDNPRSGLSLNIDLSQIKQNLAGAPGDSFVSAYVRSLEQCPSSVTIISTNELPTCIPQGVSQQQAIGAVLDYKEIFLQQIPDSWELTQDSTTSFRDLPEGFSSLRDINMLYSVLAVITLGVWVFNAIIGGRGFKGLLMWLGGMLFLPALIILLSGAAFGGSILDAVNREIAANATNNFAVSTQVEASFINILLDILKQVGNGFLTIGIIAIAVSLILYLMGAIMRRPNPYRQVQVGVGGYANDPNHPIRPL